MNTASLRTSNKCFKMKWMQITRPVSLLLLVACALAEPWRAEGQNTPAPELAISHGPFLQAPSESGVTISWVTTRKAVSWVEYREKSSAAWLTNVPAQHGLLNADTTYHNVSLSGLKPGAAYLYRAVSKEIADFKPYEVKFGPTVSSAENSFTTFDRRKSGFSFVVVNDRHENGKDLRTSWSGVDWTGVDVAFLNGDMVNAVSDERLLFDAVIAPCAEHFAQRAPLVYVRGNHETRGSPARALLNYFPTDSGRHYYTLRHGPVLFLVLDCGEDKADSSNEYHGLVAFRPYMEAQRDWLAGEIQSKAFQEAPFRVCLLHIPPSSPVDRKFVQTRWLWENFVPLLNKAGVDLILCGHTHRDAFRPAGADGIDFPMMIAGNQTLLRCDVSADEIRISRSNLAGSTFEAIPPVKARKSRR